MSHYIFGPVNSRRLGRSLGVNIIPPKICNLDCLYCEVGPTTKPECQRNFYTSWSDIQKPFFKALEEEDFDVVSVTGFGEPTLNKHLPDIARQIKKYAQKPLVLITNSLLLTDPEVRGELNDFDVILPSLDSALKSSFIKLDQPISAVTPEDIIQGLMSLRKEFAGEIHLEILFIRNINDSYEDVQALSEAINKIKPDQVQLSTLSRLPLTAIRKKYTEPFEALNYEELELIREQIDTKTLLLILKSPEDKDELINIGTFYKRKSL